MKEESLSDKIWDYPIVIDRKYQQVRFIKEEDVKEFIKKLKENEEELYKGFSHFCKCVNFNDSFLDAEAILFMNEITRYLKIDKLAGKKLI